MSFIDLGKIKFNWCGNYNPELNYEADDVVYYDGSSYVAINAIALNNSPPANGWELMAQGLTTETALLATKLELDSAISLSKHQIIQNEIVDPYYFSATTNKEISPLTTKITPKSSDRKILILVNVFYESHHDSIFKLYRNGIELSLPNNPGLRRAGLMNAVLDNDHSSTAACLNIMFLDKPASKTELTYALYHDGQPIAINRTLSDTNSINSERGKSRMILMEV